MELLKRSVGWFGGGCRSPALVEAEKVREAPVAVGMQDQDGVPLLVNVIERWLEGIACYPRSIPGTFLLVSKI